MRVHDSARKHGVDPEDAVYAATWPIWIEDLDDDSPGGSSASGSTRVAGCWKPRSWSSTAAMN